MERIEIISFLASGRAATGFVRLSIVLLILAYVLSESTGYDIGALFLGLAMFYLVYALLLAGSIDRDELLPYVEKVKRTTLELAELSEIVDNMEKELRETREAYSRVVERNDVLVQQAGVLAEERKVLLERCKTADDVLAENETLKKRVAGLQSALSRRSHDVEI